VADVDLGKLTGRVKALFMAVPKEMKHMMKTTTTTHCDGIKRWAIEVKFPYGTLEKANKSFYDENENVATGNPSRPLRHPASAMPLHVFNAPLLSLSLHRARHKNCQGIPGKL